ncbi:unnamed protein product, partial [Mesorhabditis spiculigera]
MKTVPKEKKERKTAKLKDKVDKKKKGDEEKPKAKPDGETVSEEKALAKKLKKEKKQRRKLRKKNQAAVAEGEILAPIAEKVEFDANDEASFEDFELSELLLKIVCDLGWEKPTQVQESVIPLALEHKNLMVRARTGSGKTAAFVLPILQQLITYTSGSTDLQPGPYALFIAPTKELSSQIYTLLTTFIRAYPYLRCIHLTEISETEKGVWENDQPELVVTTPGKLKTMLDIRKDYCLNVRHLVLDEADLLLSYGYEAEMKFIRSCLASKYQTIMTSATLSDDMTSLKTIFITGPVLTIKLKEGDLPDANQLTQYHLFVENDEERFAILLSMFKLKLIVGKTIIFVANPDRCYQMNLFLNAFKLNSGILNSAMPANSRCLVIQQFNQGLFPVIVASDAAHLIGDEEKTDEAPATGKRPKRKLDKEAGVARGIDFHHVSNVINFDFPKTLEGYIHRVGRTARGWNKGTALSFCTPRERAYLDTIKDQVTEMMGKPVMHQYDIRLTEIESFQLRAREALASCTKGVIREARLAEIREEALRSAKLKSYFAANPRERDVLASDKKLHTLKLTCPAMGDVPDYIVPKALRGNDYTSDQKKRHRHRVSQGKKHAMRNKKDPLKSFKV